MKKFKLFFYLPFLFSFSFLWKIIVFPGASLNVLDIFLFVAILISIWILFKENLFIEFKNYWLEKKFVSSFLLLIFLTSAIFSYTITLSFNNWTNGLGVIKSFIFLPIVFAMFVVFFIKKHFLKLSSLKKSFLFSMGLLSLGGLLAIITKSLTFDGRLRLFYDSPNHFAMLLSIAIIIGIWSLLNEKNAENKAFSNKKYRYVIGSIVFSLLINLFFTKSLGAIIAIILSTMFLLIKEKSVLVSFLKKFILIAIFIFVLFLLNISFLNYQPAIPPTSFDSRITIYQSTEKIIKENFIEGVGPGNFQENYLAFQKYFTPYPEWAVPHAHNNFLHLYAELGFFAFLAFLVLILLKISTFKQKNPDKILGFSILIYFIVHGLFDTTIWQNDTAFLFWLVLLL